MNSPFRTVNEFKNFMSKCRFFLEDANAAEPSILKQNGKERLSEKDDGKGKETVFLTFLYLKV